ncbi:hypothetical protein ACJJIG_08705 [Microbulbifer sp. SSSA007]|uniref:hypothetical protein n=1 Tax=Microbulbifer sp. SSSA007 TaxID=3243379 RepID=UPI00403A5567
MAQKKQYSNAHKAYDPAVQKNPALFSHWLKRGMASTQLKDYTSAERDLSRYLRYLDTAYVHYYLGEVYEKQGKARHGMHLSIIKGGEIGTKTQAKILALTGKG